MIDRALDYAALADSGHSASRIARLRRRSQSYVSIVLRLGRAIRGMEPAELSALRSPRITWKLAQRIVRDDTDAVTIRQQLRTALTGFSPHTLDRRRRRGVSSTARGRPSTATPSPPRIGALGSAVQMENGVAPFRWDPEAFRRDPDAFVADYVAALVTAHTAFHQSAERAALALVRGDGMSVGQSIRTLQRALQQTRRAAPTAAGSMEPDRRRTAPHETSPQRAVDVLEAVGRALQDVARLLAARRALPSPPASASTPGPLPPPDDDRPSR